MAAERHILVFRFSALGDVAMTVPVMKLLLEQHADLHVHFVSDPFMRPLFAGIDRLEFIGANTKKDYKGISGLYRLSRQLIKGNRFEAVADLHNVLRTKIIRFFLPGIKKASIDKGRSEKKELTRPVNKKLRQLKTGFERYADVFGELGFPVDLDAVYVNKPEPLAGPVLGLTNTSLSTKEAVAPVDSQSEPLPGLVPGLRNNSQSTKEVVVPNGSQPEPLPGLVPGVGNNLQSTKEVAYKLVGIAPFARHLPKMYPLDKMREVAIALASEKTVQVILFGSPAETAILETWVGPGIHSVAGKISFSHELNLISQLDLMISMDSANMHLASLYQVPVISIWGGTHPFLGFYGWRQSIGNAIQPDLPCRPSSVFGNKPCPVHGEQGCMEGITPKLITQQAVLLLGKV